MHVDRKYLPLIAILFIGTLLRVWDISHQRIIGVLDEGTTLTISLRPVSELISSTLTTDFNPPLYYLLAKLSYFLSGGDPFSIRYPSLIFGIALIATMYFVGKEYRNHNTGLYSAAIISVLYPFFYYSRYARSYSMSITIFSVLLYLFLRIKHGENNIRMYLLFGATAALGTWTHYFFLVPAVLLGIDLLVTVPGRLCNKACGGIIFAVVCSPLVLVLSGVKARAVQYGSIGWTKLQIVLFSWYNFYDVFMFFFLGLIGYELWKNKMPMSRELLGVMLGTIATGIICSGYTAIIGRYFQTVALIPIMIGAAYIDENAERQKYSVALILTIIICGMIIFQQQSYIWYFTQQEFPNFT